MSAPQWRWSAISIWIVLACIIFLTIGSTTARSWSLLLTAGVLPALMLLWLWNEDRALVAAPIRLRNRP